MLGSSGRMGPIGYLLREDKRRPETFISGLCIWSVPFPDVNNLLAEHPESSRPERRSSKSAGVDTSASSGFCCCFHVRSKATNISYK